MAKPIPEKLFLQYIKRLGWHLEKGSVDHNLYNTTNGFLCAIKIMHSKGKKREVAPSSVRKVEKLCDERNLKWPPNK